MANPFLGLTMLVTLSDPPGAQVRGVVNSVVPGVSLTLKNGKEPASTSHPSHFFGSDVIVPTHPFTNGYTDIIVGT